MAKDIDAALIREYEAHKDCSKEEMEEYLRTLPPSERERFQMYAAKMEREKRKKEQKKKEEQQNRIGCLLTVVIFAGLIGLMAYFQDNESAEDAKPAPQAKQETKDSGKQAAVSAESAESEENDKDAKAKALKLAAYNKWTEETDRQAEMVNSNWKMLWKSILSAMSKGESERKEVAKNLKSFEKKLEESKPVFSKMEFSKHLTKDEQEKLKEANADYVVWLEERQKACGEAIEIVDKDLTPEKLKEIEESIKKSDDRMKKIRARIIEFQKGMGLIPE